MKIRLLSFTAAAILLSACTTAHSPFYGRSPTQTPPPLPPAQTQQQPYQLAPSHWSDVAKIRSEAQRLGLEVQQGRMTKTQAAQYLNRFRLQTVGANQVDDSIYDVYLRSAVDSQSGKISSEQSKRFVQSALQGWQNRWLYMPSADRPTNPAFTNFMMETMGMQPLQ